MARNLDHHEFLLALEPLTPLGVPEDHIHWWWYDIHWRGLRCACGATFSDEGRLYQAETAHG